ncbi:3' terminal RNA ribose 2'-O-methyltransferase Hen1 [Actinopolymorpha pittospori]|uniref:Small RNA 2'-O-methyltransferase n=1 Tax=Actinopolymorpha pittospori TaxID=648752 RepID=A0A927NE39_9ACTN|nr:3' terminal RNA ribose 2'-O-methyltransferase Hen1 [Actinopolymorpha pittospori]
MFLTLTSTAPNATDLGFLLHKHPDRVQSFDLSVGTAHVFYPRADDDRCTVALLVEVDPIRLVRGRRFGGDGFALAQYVNDRPHAASSMLAVALGRVFRSAMRGRCKERPDLEGALLPLEIHLPSLPSSGGADLVERLFAPLGWRVTASTHPLDPEVPSWGESRYVDTHLAGTMTLDAALSHLYVLLPVLDGAKHYWVSTEEIDKLVRGGGTWLRTHPERDLIMRRYLAHQSGYVSDAAERLAALDDTMSAQVEEQADTATNEQSEQREPLVRIRRAAVLAELRTLRATRVVDLGCGEGALLRDLIADPSFTEIVGVDVAPRELDRAARRLDLDRMPDSQRARLSLLQSSATYRDSRLEGYDAIVLMEVVEHLDPERLPALERTVFAHARPSAVVVTTPNVEFNARYESLRAGGMRHPDHRFEWSRAEFEAWARRAGNAHGYDVRFVPIGELDPDLGPPTQMAVFTRITDALETSDGEPRAEVSA